MIDVIGEGKVIHLEPRHEVKHSVATFQKSIDILEFNHITDLREGLIKMWNWAKKQPMRKRFEWENYELDKGIYSFWKKKSINENFNNWIKRISVCVQWI